MKAALHSVESQRLAALRSYGILDTPRESEFDDVVKVVSAICRVPISVINLIDDGRQWFKAEVGLGVRETPLDSSICAHAILQPDLMIVPDTTKDPRFIDNPLVTGEPHLRFYAGALLQSSDGMPLGTVCVLDYEPRTLNENEQALLRLMASQVMKQLELRRVNAKERESRLKAEALADENATLAREGDHRVMNSLQLVQSVLSLQARKAENIEVRSELQAASDRVLAIATVHKQLHLTGSLEQIEIATFLRRLCENLDKNAPSNVTSLDVVAEPLRIDSAAASTIGLIVAELVINAFKHAYRGDRTGPVTVRFEPAGAGWCLDVSDVGVGLPEGFDIDRSTGIGMRVVTALVRRLSAKLTVESAPGATRFRVTCEKTEVAAPQP